MTMTAVAASKLTLISLSQSFPGLTTPGTLDAKTLTPLAKIRRISSWITFAIGSSVTA